MDIEEAHARVLADARRVVAALEAVDPTDLTRDNWETELADYLAALNSLDDADPLLYRALYDETSAKGCIREYLRDHLGEPVTSDRIARVSGINQYARRIRELRNEEGFVIDSTRTRAELGTSDYYPVEIRDDAPQKSRITAQQRYEQLKRQPTCELCGRGVDANKVQWMEVDHIEPYVDGDDATVNDSENLQTLCNLCHDGKSSSSGVNNPE